MPVLNLFAPVLTGLASPTLALAGPSCSWLLAAGTRGWSSSWWGRYEADTRWWWRGQYKEEAVFEVTRPVRGGDGGDGNWRRWWWCGRYEEEVVVVVMRPVWGDGGGGEGGDVAGWRWWWCGHYEKVVVVADVAGTRRWWYLSTVHRSVRQSFTSPFAVPFISRRSARHSWFRLSFIAPARVSPSSCSFPFSSVLCCLCCCCQSQYLP